MAKKSIDIEELVLFSENKFTGDRDIMTKNNNIGLDRIRLVASDVDMAVDTSRIRGIQKGEGAMVFDIATGEAVGIATINLNINGIGLGEGDNSAIQVKSSNFDKNSFVISVNCAKLLYNSNERNVTKDKVELVGQIVEKKLAEYGLYVDASTLKISSIEVNYNVDDVKLYDTLEMITKASLKDGQKVLQAVTKDGIQSLKVNKGRYELKIYKKSEQLKETGNITDTDNLVRFEISTSHSQELDKLIPSRSLMDLVNNWDGVEAWYKRCITNSIKKPIVKYKNEIEGRMVASMDAGKKPSKAVLELLLENDLMDISIVGSAVKKHYKNTGKKKPSSVINGINKKLKEANSTRYEKMTGNLEKLEEFFNELGV